MHNCKFCRADSRTSMGLLVIVIEWKEIAVTVLISGWFRILVIIHDCGLIPIIKALNRPIVPINNIARRKVGWDWGIVVNWLSVRSQRDFFILHAWRIVVASWAMREAIVSADIDTPWLNCCVSGVQTGPITAEIWVTGELAIARLRIFRGKKTLLSRRQKFPWNRTK